MSDDLFPSDPWAGFYNYSPKDKHRMDIDLTFEILDCGGKRSATPLSAVGTHTKRRCRRYALPPHSKIFAVPKQ